MYMAFICVHNHRPAFWILAASVLLALIVSVLLLTYPGMKNYTLTIGGEDYIIRSTARLDAEFKAIRYTEDGEPVGTLYLSGSSPQKVTTDLSSLVSCGELQLIQIQVDSQLSELILPAKDYLTCYVQAEGIGRIYGENAGGVDLILNASPTELDFPNCAVNDLTVEGAMDLSFLKKGVYRTVSLFRSFCLTAPDSSCDIDSLSLGSGEWDLSPLEGNEKLTYLSVNGYGIDLSPLIGTKIGQLYVGGVCDLTPLQEMPDLKILSVRFSEAVSNDLTPLQYLRLECLNIVTDWEIPAVNGTRNREEISALCNAVPGLSEYLPILLTCASKGTDIGTTQVRPGLVEDGTSVFDLLPGTVPEKPDPPPLPGEEPSDPLTEQLSERMEGYYLHVAVYHPEMQQPDVDHEAFRVHDGRLYGFLLAEGEWEDLGEIRTVNITEETAEQVFRNAVYSKGYMVDPPGLFRTLRYRAVTGGDVYYFDLDGPERNGEIACVRNGRIRWFIQTVGKEDLEGDYHYACTMTEAVLPWQLDINIYDRTYVLQIPCSNSRSEGTFRFTKDGEMEITDAENGVRHYFLPEEFGYRTVPGWQISDGTGMKENLLFRVSAYYILKEMYGCAEADLDGDGIAETIRLGDMGYPGSLGLCVSVDSIETDAYQSYYAEWGDVTLVTEKGKVYGEIVYHVNPRDRQETKTARFEIHFDGKDLWLTDMLGDVIRDRIDLKEQAE